MREMVFRERREKVAHLEAIVQIAGRLFNIDTDTVLGHVVRDYAAEVFQETYDAELLKEKATALRRTQRKIRATRDERLRMLNKLEQMGAVVDKIRGPSITAPPPKPAPAPSPPRAPRKAPG